MRTNFIDRRRADLHEAKPSLRKRILGRRDAMDSHTLTALSRAIVWDIVETSVYRRSNMIMAYASFGSGLQTGKILLLPRVNRQRELLEVYWVQDPEQDLQVGTWGIREPRPGRCARGTGRHRLRVGSRSCV